MKKNTRSNNMDKPKYKVGSCPGHKCKNRPIATLKVRYINKIGHFCQKYASKLLQLELAEEISKGLPQ